MRKSKRKKKDYNGTLKIIMNQILILGFDLFVLMEYKLCGLLL